MARNPRARIERRFSHTAVRGYASRGRGKVWHLIVKGPVVPSTATATHQGPYPWPRYKSLCGTHVETLAQLEAAAASAGPELLLPPHLDVPTLFCPCCASTSDSRLPTVWAKAVVAGEWRLAAADMLNMLDRLDTVYLGAGELAPLR